MDFIKALLQDFEGTLLSTYQQVTELLIQRVPDLLAAAMLLLLGYITAKLLSWVTRVIFRRTEHLVRRKTAGDLNHPVASSALPRVAGVFVFWIILIFFFTATANLLNFKVLETIFITLLNFVPKLLLAVAIIFAGLVLSRVLASMLRTTHWLGNIQQTKLATFALQVAVMFTAFVLGLAQVGIHISFLIDIFIVCIGLFLLGFAIAFGFGAKSFVANAIATEVAKKKLTIGAHITCDNISGEVIEIGANYIIIDSKEGQVMLPAAKLLDHPVLVEKDASDGSLLSGFLK